MDIKKIRNSTIKIPDQRLKIRYLAFLSLKMSLKAYFSTYRSIAFRYSELKRTSFNDEEQNTSNAYIEQACEAITHLQHFIELLLKHILEDESILLAIDVRKKVGLLYNIINGNPYNERDLESERQIEFKEAFDRVIELMKLDLIDRKKYSFIEEAKGLITEINYMRNRIAHRGAYIYSYSAMDYLFGKYVFPFIKDALSFIGKEKWCKRFRGYGKNGEFNVIDELISHFKSDHCNIDKVALLKEMGRACFENPINYRLGASSETMKNEHIAIEMSKFEELGEVLHCPVCRTKSLVRTHFSVDGINESSGERNYFMVPYDIKCYCCSFNIQFHIKDSHKMNLGLPDYWEEV